MQPFSSTCEHLSDVNCNPCLGEAVRTSPSGKLGKFSVVVQSAVTSFFSSLSPNYIPEHQRQIRQPTADASAVPAENKNDKTSLADHVVQGVGLASKALSCWVPNVSAVSDAIGTICSSISLANTLDTMAMSGKSGRESASRADNVPKIHSPKITNTKITNNNREDDQPDKSATTFGRANRVSGPAMATVTLMAMDQLAGAAARPAEGERGSQSNPILVEDSATLGKIGKPDYPLDVYYLQTQSFSHNTIVPVGNGTKPFQGHYDGGCHTIRDLKNCTFGELGFGAEVENLRIAYATIEQSELASATIDQPDQHYAILACKMSGESAVSHVRVEHGIVSTRLSGTDQDPATTGVITGLLGKGSNLTDIDIVNCSVTTSGQYTYTGVGAGWVEGNIERMTVAGTDVTSAVDEYPVAIGGGQVTGEIKQLTVNNCRVTVTGSGGNAAIGGGEVGRDVPPGTFGKVSELVALNSHVSNNHFAAIGAGRVVNNGSEINGITAINCSVSAKFYAAIGAGLISGQVTDTTAVNCEVNSLIADIGVGSKFGIGDVSGTASLNSKVNGQLTNIGKVTLRGLCSTADTRIVNDDCQLTLDSFFEDHWNCSTTSTTSAPARSPATPLNSLLPQTTAAYVNKTGVADTTSQQPVMTPLNTKTMANSADQLSRPALTSSVAFDKTAMANTTSPLSSQALTSSVAFDKTAMANTTSPLSSQALTSSASLNKTAMANTTSPALTSPASFDKTAMANTTSPLSSQAPTSSASLNKTAMANTASLLLSPALTSPASFDKTAIANTTSPLSSQAPTSSAPLDKTTMANTSSLLPGQVLTTPALLDKTAMANISSLLPGQVLTTPALLDKMIMPKTTTTGHAMATPLPSINATISAPSAMITTAPVTPGVVTLSQTPMTFSGIASTTAMPTTPPPLDDTLNIGVVLAVSFGTAFTILAGIGLCALYQYYHRRGEAQVTAEPEIPLEHLNQANP